MLRLPGMFFNSDPPTHTPHPVAQSLTLFRCQLRCPRSKSVAVCCACPGWVSFVALTGPALVTDFLLASGSPGPLRGLAQVW